MESRREFIDKYDMIMPMFCKPYFEFLKVGAEAIPKNMHSLYDLGIGTGNFSQAVKKRVPGIKVYGIDFDIQQVERTKAKIKNAVLYQGDFFSVPFPETDCIISSMALHHLDTESRGEKLIKIAKSSGLFVNFDMVLFPGYDLEKVVRTISDFTKRSFSPEQVKEVEKEIREKDNPMPLEEQIRLFESEGFSLEILAANPPYVVYSVENMNE